MLLIPNVETNKIMKTRIKKRAKMSKIKDVI